MKKALPLLILFLLCFSNIHAQQSSPPRSYRLLQIPDWVQSKNYYLLTLLEQDKETNQLLSSDAELAQLVQHKLNALKTSLTDCRDYSCFTGNIKFTQEEITQVSNKLRQLYKPDNALGKLVKNHLTPSGTYILNSQLSPVEQLVHAWEQDAAGINYTIAVYAEGKRPNYPNIDSISFNVKARSYFTLVYDVNSTLVGDIKNTHLFFEPSLHAALLYLQINEREDPANYEPMVSTVNKAAFNNVKQVNWNSYPYTVILVPGAGPDNLSTPLSAEGMLRCRLAAQQYHLKQAPFIIVSGGKVHPYKTKYCEAEEMKTYLVQKLNIPESAIIAEPHARHTTTNMRNGTRLMFRYGIPFNKPGIVVTDKYQTDYITNMADRCMKELAYVPYKLGKRLSETVLEFYPLYESLQINPYEPLDP